ncbi:MAG: zinc ABC transporter substrate-binding protein [Gammaproteobacteria bacterium]|nr:zinc ABC transporter substrate-binding protein [Gammaproteobacteria bacterium]MBU1654969.1 zinc ABC transporter substrate-binding protein [Gammaproteobacteria bacterium]MBU1960065.1 zinc ABC transporter substrate-binding protein [Gammaproteobacteria bacterium]
MSIPRFTALALLALLAELAAAAPPRVLVSLKPVHSLVAGVMAGVGWPELLLDGGQSPHHFALRPSDRRKIEAAGLVVWVGEGLETPLAGLMAARGRGRPQLELMEAPGMDLGPAEAADGEGRGHRHAKGDPHIWLSLANADLIVRLLVDELGRLDPANGERYRANGERLREDLGRLDRELAVKLTPVRDIPFVVFHDAYGHFERRHGLKGLGALALNPERQPGARRVAELHERIRSAGVRCVFSEPQFPPKLVDVLIEGTDARKGVLDPLGANLPAGPEAYSRLMRGLADAYVGCLHH